MSPRNHFAQSQFNPYFSSHGYKDSKGGMYEDKVNKKLDSIVSIPRRFWAGVKKISKSLYKTLR